MNSTQRAEALRKAREVFYKNVSARYMDLDRLERYHNGTQYEGRPGWFDTADTPLHERAPCIVYPIVPNAIKSHIAFAMGSDRWAKITSHPAEDDGSVGDALPSDDSKDGEGEYGLSEKDSATLDAYINALSKASRLRGAAAKALEAGMRSKSEVTILAVRNGKPVHEHTRAKWCTPKFVVGTDFTVESLEIRYPYVVEKQNPISREYEATVYLYRRVIDGLRDVTYKPVEASNDGSEPPASAWVVNKALTIEHGLGFCPVIWYPFKAKVDSTEVFDGHAIHEELLDEIDCLNMALSQKHRAAFYSGDPQIVETGVARDWNQAEIGRSVVMVDRAENGVYMSGRSEPGGGAIRKGASVLWRYEDKDVNVSLLTLPGDALKALEENCKDIRAKLQEALCFVSVDPEQIKFSAELSGRALTILFARQTSECDGIRDDFGNGWLLKTVDMWLRITATLGRKGKSLMVRGFGDVLPVLKRFERTESEEAADGDSEPPGAEPAFETMDWVSPELDLIWGEYFPQTAQDELYEIQAAKLAKEGGLITDVIGIEKVAKAFSIKNPVEVAELVKADQEAQRQAEMDMMAAQVKLKAQAKGPNV